MKKIPFFLKFPKAHNPEEIFTLEEQDETLELLEYTTEFFPELELEDEQ